MKKIIFTILTYFFYSIVGYSHDLSTSLLWKVSKESSNKVSYIFGTFHHVNPDFFNSLSIANEKLITSDLLLVEIDNHSPKPILSHNEVGDDKMYNEKWDRNKWKDAISKEQFLTFEKFSNSDWIDESLFEYNPRQLMFVLHLMYFQGVVDTVNRSSYQLLDDRIVQIGMTNNLAIKSLDTEIDRVLDLSVQYDQSLSIKESIKSDITFIDYIMNKNTSNKIANNLYDYKRPWGRTSL